MTWKEYARRLKRLEEKHLPAVQRAIAAYKSTFCDDVTTSGIDAAKSRLNTAPIGSEITTALQDIYKTGGLLGAQIADAELKKGLKWGGLGKNQSWINAVLDYLKINILTFAANITNTTRDDILKILEKGIDEGWSVDMIVKAIQDPEITAARARVIVRTESVRAFNVGHSIGAQSFPYEVNKKWIAARDHRTRHSHQTVNGKVVGEHETFAVDVYKNKVKVGVDQMQFPGDPTADPSNTINCRCRVVYEPLKDSLGRPIPRVNKTPVAVRDHRTSNLIAQ